MDLLESLRATHELVLDGSIRRIGMSNYHAVGHGPTAPRGGAARPLLAPGPSLLVRAAS